MYSFLDKNYIEKYNIKQETALSNVENYKEPAFFVDKMYVIQNTTQVYTYFVYGKLIDKETTKSSKFNVVIRLDKENDLFSVIPYKFVEDSNYNISIGNTISLKYNEISNNIYNEFAFKNVTDEEMINHYISDMKDRMIYDVESIYDRLDKTYRENKFTSEEECKNYITKNIMQIYKLNVKKYQIENYDSYKQYICVDQDSNYYIINETNPGQYELILDIYTIDIPIYIEAYNKATDTQKGTICIDKFMKNVNSGNYTLAYKMLSEGFKNNYFKNEASFVDYAITHFLGKNISFKENQTQEGLYIYKIILSQEDLGETEKNFVMQLKEGTDFELSFEM